MNIVHIGLACHYTEGMTYQDNIMTDINCRDGHNVTYISDVYRYEEGRLVKGSEEDITLSSSLRLIRLSYDRVVNDIVSAKIQKCDKLEDVLKELQPDTILYHGVCGGGYALFAVMKYVKKHPSVIFYADSHATFENTAKTFLAKIFYKYIHGYFVKKALPYISKIFYLSIHEKQYLQKIYHIDESKLEWLPLGGIIFELEKKKIYKEYLVSQLQLPKDCIIFGHSGKLEKGKKTAELIHAFVEANIKNSALIIFGSVPEENQHELLPLMESDPKIFYLGWKRGSEIFDLLLAIDIYCQPGTGSATLQNAICCGCAAILYPYESYKRLIDGNAYFVKTEQDIRNAMLEISNNPVMLEDMKKKAHNLANKFLDYKKIAARIYR